MTEATGRGEIEAIHPNYYQIEPTGLWWLLVKMLGEDRRLPRPEDTKRRRIAKDYNATAGFAIERLMPDIAKLSDRERVALDNVSGRVSMVMHRMRETIVRDHGGDHATELDILDGVLRGADRVIATATDCSRKGESSFTHTYYLRRRQRGEGKWYYCEFIPDPSVPSTPGSEEAIRSGLLELIGVRSIPDGPNSALRKVSQTDIPHVFLVEEGGETALVVAHEEESLKGDKFTIVRPQANRP